MIQFRVQVLDLTREKAESVVAALELLEVKATITEYGSLGEMIDNDVREQENKK